MYGDGKVLLVRLYNFEKVRAKAINFLLKAYPLCMGLQYNNFGMRGVSKQSILLDFQLEG